jgi:glutamine synthetase
MREEGGYAIIKEAINKLGLRHKEHIASYGEGNERRLTGRHETADMNSFSWVRLVYNCNHCYVIKTLLYQPKPWVLGYFCNTTFMHSNGVNGNVNVQGVANRGASIRVGRDTEKEGKGETILECSWNVSDLMGGGLF